MPTTASVATRATTETIRCLIYQKKKGEEKVRSKRRKEKKGGMGKLGVTKTRRGKGIGRRKTYPQSKLGWGKLSLFEEMHYNESDKLNKDELDILSNEVIKISRKMYHQHLKSIDLTKPNICYMKDVIRNKK